MSRRLVLLASLLLLGLSGCVTMNEGYYREGYYSDGGYYYPAEDGYGDYYQGPEDIDYRYYDSYSYEPFWRLDRYACGAYYSCSPYWNSYYRRPYSGWSLSFGSHWSYGNWGWYGNQWNPWYDHRDYWRHSRHPRRPDPGSTLPPGVLTPPGPGNQRPPREDYTIRPRPGLREPGVIYEGEGRPRLRPGGDRGPGQPGPGPGPGPGQDVMPVRGDGEGYVRPLPRPDFRDREDRKPAPINAPGRGVSPAPTQEADMPRPDYRDFREPARRPPQEAPRYERPQPREMPRYERSEAREMPRYERPEPREMPRYERPEPRETPRYERPEPREMPRPEPREAPRFERPEPREMPTASQNERPEREE